MIAQLLLESRGVFAGANPLTSPDCLPTRVQTPRPLSWQPLEVPGLEGMAEIQHTSQSAEVCQHLSSTNTFHYANRQLVAGCLHHKLCTSHLLASSTADLGG